jgi:5-methyltetrahydropteroyltriglutamate--homocysteine methyltransferase
MKRSTERILTSHVGALPRDRDLLDKFAQDAPAEALEPTLKAAVARVVKKQIETGIDIVNDGEFGKPMSDEVDFGAWLSYAYERLSGFEDRPVEQGIPPFFDQSRDFARFADFYASLPELHDRRGSARRRFKINTGPIRYIGHAAMRRDIANLKAALADNKAGDVFITSLATGIPFVPGTYYANAEEEGAATATAMREEYKMIVDAGFNVQLDDPIIVNQFELFHSMDWDVAGYRKWAARHVEVVNASLDGIPEDRVRYHVCWGSWNGPHSADAPLKDVIDIILKVKAGLYSIEAANPQHEHEWKLWKEVKLPPGRMVMPGVVTHKTNILEHRELVADRLMKYAEAVGRENVVAGTDCGMGGRIHPSLAWAKLKAMREGADIASKQLWRR